MILFFFYSIILVHYKYVLSGAHCFFKSNDNTAANLQVITGYKEYPSTEDPLEFASYPIESIKVHENYADTTPSQVNDIAVIKLKESIRFTRRASPVCLPLSPSFVDEIFYSRKTYDFVGWSIYR